MSATLAWVGCGVFGALGALARFHVGSAVMARWPGAFPLGTFVVNLSGGCALGVLTGLGLSSRPMLVLGTGFMGGYTTFSTWMVEDQRLGEDGEWTLVWLYLFGSMAAGLVVTGLGWLIGSALA